MPNTNLAVENWRKYCRKLFNSKRLSDFSEKLRTRFGEIDIIAQSKQKISFIEVKTRIGIKKGMPFEAINYYKIKHLRYAAQLFLLQKKLKNYKLSLDVIAIILNEDLTIKRINFFANIIS
jgi:putative endonuclease